jgi:hypothetical protein
MIPDGIIKAINKYIAFVKFKPISATPAKFAKGTIKKVAINHKIIPNINEAIDA